MRRGVLRRKRDGARGRSSSGSAGPEQAGTISGGTPSGAGVPAPTPAVSPLRERARDAAEAIHADNSARWFPLREIFPVYNYLYDYYRANPEDARLRRLAREAVERLGQIADSLEANAAGNPLPPEWADARAALTEAAKVIELITEAW